MKLQKKYLILVILVYFLSVLAGPLTAIRFYQRLHLVSYTPSFFFSFLQRSTALVALPMMAVQIFLGSDMARMVKKIGNWVVRFHFNHGIVIYSLIIAHTLSFLIFKYIASSKLDPFYVYTDFCLLCQVKTELFYTFGRLSFWILSFSVSAAYFKNTDTFKKNWKFFHIANYLVFVLAAVHAFFIGHDILSIPYLFVYILSCLFVLYVFGSRLIRAYREIR